MLSNMQAHSENAGHKVRRRTAVFDMIYKFGQQTTAPERNQFLGQVYAKLLSLLACQCRLASAAYLPFVGPCCSSQCSCAWVFLGWAFADSFT